METANSVLALSLDETRRGQAALPNSPASAGPQTIMKAPAYGDPKTGPNQR